MGRPRSHRKSRRDSARVLRLSPRASVRADLDLALHTRSVWHSTKRTPSVLRLDFLEQILLLWNVRAEIAVEIPDE